MKFLLLVVLFFANISARATTYYLSPNGNDSSTGLQLQSPWLTPYHQNLRCGTDRIVALPSTAYTAKQFAEWGTVNCPTQDNVVWLQCEKFDACKLTMPQGLNSFGISIDRSFWGVKGFEIDSLNTSPNGQTCFNVAPPNPSSPSIRNVIFANNVAVNCPAASFGGGVAYRGLNSIDYVAYIENISYGAAATNFTCNSGFVIFTPVNADNKPGTHLYVADNFAIASSNPANSNCVDGNGIILDTLDGSTSSEPRPYSGQAVVQNNIAIGNGGVGIRLYGNNRGKGPFSKIFVVNNTAWGNSQGKYQAGNPDCGEIQMYFAENVLASKNLAVTNQSGCYGIASTPNSAFDAVNQTASSSIEDNWGYAVPIGSAVNASPWPYIPSSPFKVSNNNKFGEEPMFLHPEVPGRPECSGKVNVRHCMAKIIEDFTPRVQAARNYGYQLEAHKLANPELYPAWLCNVDLPAGSEKVGCGASLLQKKEED